jgi:hypothetical protein
MIDLQKYDLPLEEMALNPPASKEQAAAQAARDWRGAAIFTPEELEECRRTSWTVQMNLGTQLTNQPLRPGQPNVHALGTNKTK